MMSLTEGSRADHRVAAVVTTSGRGGGGRGWHVGLERVARLGVSLRRAAKTTSYEYDDRCVTEIQINSFTLNEEPC